MSIEGRGIAWAGSCVALTVMLGACGSTNKSAGAPSAASSAAGGASAAASASAAPEEEDKPMPKPFAKNSAEATSMMDDAVEKKRKRINKCVDAYRKRRNEPMAKLVVKIGVDQEGTLIGVTGKPTETDPEALDCIRTALKFAPFPKSHSGVIEITKTFEYQAIYGE
jgi:outer membrane biosynthesis protein TonB